MSDSSFESHRIVVTRARHQISAFSEKLRSYGAEPVEIPAIRIAPPSNWSSVDERIQNLSHYQWLVFTSTNGVAMFFDRMDHHNSTIPEQCSIASVGPATSEELKSRGISVDLQPSNQFRTSQLGLDLQEVLPPNTNVLLPRSNRANPQLTEILREAGHNPDEIHVYRLVPNNQIPPDTLKTRFTPEPDLLTFASSMTVEYFCDITFPHLDSEHILDIPCACIGPVTAETARKKEFDVIIKPEQYTIPDLAEAINKKFLQPA